MLTPEYKWGEVVRADKENWCFLCDQYYPAGSLIVFIRKPHRFELAHVECAWPSDNVFGKPALYPKKADKEKAPVVQAMVVVAPQPLIPLPRVTTETVEGDRGQPNHLVRVDGVLFEALTNRVHSQGYEVCLRRFLSDPEKFLRLLDPITIRSFLSVWTNHAVTE